MIYSGEKKKHLCLSLGASAFFDYKIDDVEHGVHDLTSGLGAHAVICTAHGEGPYMQSMRLLRRLGILVCVGIPGTPFRLPATPLDMIVKGKYNSVELTKDLNTTNNWVCRTDDRGEFRWNQDGDGRIDGHGGKRRRPSAYRVLQTRSD